MSGKKPTLAVVTLGCSKNQVDTEHLLAQIQDNYSIVNSESNADYLLLNTCGFIGDAKEESIQAVLEAAKRKKNGEVGKLLVFGCLSQRYIGELPKLTPEVDGWFGARDLNPLIKALGVEPKKEMLNSRVISDVVHIVQSHSSGEHINPYLLKIWWMRPVH